MISTTLGERTKYEPTDVNRLPRFRVGFLDMLEVDGSAIEQGRSHRIIVKDIQENMTTFQLRFCAIKSEIVNTTPNKIWQENMLGR